MGPEEDGERILSRDGRESTTTEAYLRKVVRALGGFTLKNDPVINPGIPDRVIFLPGGITAFAEAKRPRRGAVSELQENNIAHLISLGFTASVVANRGQVDELIAGLLAEPRAKDIK